MRSPGRPLSAVSLLLALSACSTPDPVSPARALSPGLPGVSAMLAATLPPVRLSELHYDNAGTDAGEAIEISGPAGTDLTGWSLVLYNGNGGTAYDTRALSGLIPTTCALRGVVVETWPSNGIQNGGPDGVALVDATGAVVEFLSYEGAFTAVGGPADAVTSLDIGVAETTGTPVGQSLARDGTGVWSGPAASTFGTCNDEDIGAPPPPPPPTPGLPAVRFSEIHYDNASTDVGEAIEVEGPAGTDLTGWQIVLYNGNGGVSYNTQVLSGLIPDLCTGRGVVVATYPSNGIQNGSPDGFALVDAGNQVVEFLSYEGAMTATDGPAAGLTATDIGVSETTSAPIGTSLQRTATGSWSPSAPATFGQCNDTGAPPPAGNTISFSGRTAGDPPLPVGFQDQLFATVRDGVGTILTTAVITWSSDTPALATIDANGVMTALAAGTATLRATADDGTTATTSLPTIVATASSTALYAGNTEFGTPADADPSDDLLVQRPQYTASWNPARGIPNWVSYDLEVTHFGSEDRCDCFTFDPALPPGLPRYTTADYTGAGTFQGYGIDRGHLARSFDRTTGSLDNATTFYFSNIIPQAADVNQGPWAALESFLGDRARFDNREVYIVTGASGTKGTVKGEGKITIPAFVWKVALILPRDQGLAHVTTATAAEVVAVIMPNDPGLRNTPWQSFQTTVDAIETLSGYDLLALLLDPVEIAIESGTLPPVAVVDGPFSGDEGSTVGLSGAASTDPDGDPLAFAWNLGDGTTATGPTVSHTWANDGVFSVRLIVTDVLGLADTVTTTATIANVAPLIAPLDTMTVLVGETWQSAGAFSDPGADAPWSATVDFGDGTGVVPVPLTGKTFQLAHAYLAAGIFTVTVRVADDDVTTTRTGSVAVLTPGGAIPAALVLAGNLVRDGLLGAGEGQSLVAKLQAAERSLARDQLGAARLQLQSLLLELRALLLSGRVTAGEIDPLENLVQRMVEAIGT